MARRVFAWQCQHCGALKRTELIAKRHEAACLHNPNARNCILCIHGYDSRDAFQIQVGIGRTHLKCSKRRINCSTAVSVKCEYFKNKYLCQPSDGSETVY